MQLYYNLLAFWILFGALTFLYLLFSKVKVPYGRHQNNKWGRSVDNSWGWFWMELPALIVMPLLVIIGPVEKKILYSFHFVTMGASLFL